MRDLNAIEERELMENAMKKQDDENAGASMAELFARKREAAEKALTDMKANP